MDIRGMQTSLQQFQSMLMQMLQQEMYIKKSNASWLERSLKQYAEQEAMAKRLQDYGLNKDIALATAKAVIGGTKNLDRPGPEISGRLKEAGMESHPGYKGLQPTVTPEQANAPVQEALQSIFFQTLPESSIDEREALINAQPTLGSKELLKQAEDIRKYEEAAKDRALKKKGQALTETGLGLRREELAHKKTGTEKVDKAIAKIESLREKRSVLLDKMSPTAIAAFFGNTTKAEKGFIKHALRLGRDIKRLKGTVKGYDDPDQIYGEVAKVAKEGGTTREFIMKILLGKELSPREETAKEKLKGYLDDIGLRLPILMEYF